MSTDTLLRSTVHPPCPKDQEVLEITVPIDRHELTLADRLSLRLGLWLALRAQRSHRAPANELDHDELWRRFTARGATDREALTVLTYDMQRHLL